MNQQAEFPEVQPLKCKIPTKRAHHILIESGRSTALAAALKELEAMQKQHPAVPGLTLAIAIVARQAAEAQMNMSRDVLILAAQSRMPIEGHATTLAFEDDGLYIESLPPSAE